MQLPHRIGPYDVQEKLGDGGTGVVLRCVHRDNGQPAAVKIPRTSAASAREALRREIGILGRLRRAQLRGVVHLIEHGGGQDLPWYAMELLEGHSLRHWQQRLWSRALPTASRETSLTRTTDIASLLDDEAPPLARREPTSPSRADATRPVAAGQLERVLRVFLRLSETLAQLHADGVVHGDLAPANVVLRDETDPVLIDFGAALTELGLNNPELSEQRLEARGTAGYLAPELILGELFDSRCDLYALGCILYEVLTGRSAFSGSRARDVLRQQLHHLPLPASACVGGVPDKLDALLRAMLEKDPRRRLSRAEDVCDVLRECMQGNPRAPATKSTPGLFGPRLFGRTDALTKLDEHLRATLAGEGGLALIAGDSGIGKTRLMTEVGKRAARAGMQVLWARAKRATSSQLAGQGVPAGAFEMFMPLLESLYERELQEAAPELEAFRSLAVIAPPLAQRAGQDDVRELAPDAVLQRAFTAMGRVLGRAAGDNGLLVLIDDLQWADPLSLQFIESCSARITGQRVSLIANYRSDELGARSERLARDARCHVVLTQLDRLDTRDMVADLLALEPIPETLLTFLARHAEGNPFFVAEYTRAAISQGLLQRLPGGHWQFAANRAQELDVPQSIAGLFRLRVQQLSERARDALQLASILERDFDADALQALLGPEVDCAEALEELVARDVFAPGAPGRYRFIHDKLREAQAGALEPAERKHHHVRVAQHLEQIAAHDADNADAGAAAGYHWASAGKPERALTHLVPAARSAAASGIALERAVELFTLALQQCEQLRDTGAEQLCLREELADVLIRKASYAEARACLERLLEQLDPDQHVARARVWRKLASTHWIVHEYAAASDALDRAERELPALEESDPAEHWIEAIQIRLNRCDQMYFAGQLGPELERRIREVEPSIERHGTPDQACTYYFTAASYAMLVKRYAFDAQAVQLAERGLAAARTLPAVRVAHAHFILAYTLALGDVAQCHVALEHFALAQERALRTGDATLISRILTYDALTRVRVGDVQRTAAAARAALDAAQTAQMTPYVAAAHYCQGWVAWRNGDTASAEVLLQKARASWRNSAHKFPFQSLAAFALIAIMHPRDDFDAIRALLSEIQTGLPALPTDLEQAIAVALGELEAHPGMRASRAVAEVLRLAQSHALI